MPSSKKVKNINLLPQNEFEVSNFGRILKWALSTFRIIVIITELIVMSAFLSRFWLDAKNSDLTDELNTSKRQVEAFSEIEAEFRKVQNKVNIAREIYKNKNNSELISKIVKYLPEDVLMTSLNINNNKLAIKALSSTEKSIAQIVVNLNDFKDIENVSVSQVSSNTNNGNLINFSIEADLPK